MVLECPLYLLVVLGLECGLLQVYLQRLSNGSLTAL
jgi:hypothetical protein